MTQAKPLPVVSRSGSMTKNTASISRVAVGIIGLLGTTTILKKSMSRRIRGSKLFLKILTTLAGSKS